MQVDEHVVLPFGSRSKHGRPCVLFIEDDPHMQEVVASLFSYMDFRVIRCSSVQALLAAVRHPKSFDLIVSDVGNCGERDCLTIQEICKAMPNVLVLLTSGHAEERCRSELLHCGKSCSVGFLPKRFSLHDLQNAVRMILLREPLASRHSRARSRSSRPAMLGLQGFSGEPL